MDQAALVASKGPSKADVEIGGRILHALVGRRIPVAVGDWHFFPELEEWQFIIATPWIDEKGPLATHRAFLDALRDAGVYEKVPTRRVRLCSPRDSLVEQMQAEMEYRHQGWLHIIRNLDGSYLVSFAPIAGPGGAIPVRRFEGESELRGFLSERVGLRDDLIREGLTPFRGTGSWSIPGVALTPRQLKALGLAAAPGTRRR